MVILGAVLFLMLGVLSCDSAASDGLMTRTPGSHGGEADAAAIRVVEAGSRGSVTAGGKADGSAEAMDGPPELDSSAAAEAGQCTSNRNCATGERCLFGDCVFEPHECNPSAATCDAPPPPCDAGLVPAVTEDGCWGDCVLLDTCGYLEECSFCEESGQLCLKQVRELGDAHRCAPLPADCDPSSCECVGHLCGARQCASADAGVVSCVAVLQPTESEEDTSQETAEPGGGGASGDDASEDAQPQAQPEPEPSDLDNIDIPDGVTTPQSGSYLEGRGANCGECGWDSCDRELVVCLGDQECSQWHGCLVFCAGYEGDELLDCQMECLETDEAGARRVLDGLACLAEECCEECSLSCG